MLKVCLKGLKKDPLSIYINICLFLLNRHSVLGFQPNCTHANTHHNIKRYDHIPIFFLHSNLRKLDKSVRPKNETENL